MTSQWFPPSEWWEPAELAELMGVQTQQVYRWIKAGKIEVVRRPPPFDGRRMWISKKVMSEMLTQDSSEV